jgi:hypothetical protein
MITQQKPTEEWQQSLVAGWKGCASVSITLKQAQPGDVILARYTRPDNEDSPPREYMDSAVIFIMLSAPEENSARHIPALEIARFSDTGELLGSVSWGITSLPEGTELWLLGVCNGIRLPDARWLELSLNDERR